MNKVIICRGIPGSGKSTWAKQWVQQSPKNRIRINYDDMRMMFGQYWVPQREKIPFLKDIKNSIIRNAIYNDFDIVIDNMNLNPKEINDIRYEVQEACYERSCREGKNISYDFEFEDFKTPLNECIERDSRRPNKIGAEKITEIYNKYIKFYEE
jgi:tRNA uridine 5-carbamoylmethylation protein Kti12